MKTVFYDIESLKDLFSVAAYSAHTNTLEIFYLTSIKLQDFNIINAEILDKNKNLAALKPKIRYYDLGTANGTSRLATLIGITGYGAPDTMKITPDYEDWDGEITPYLFGYNSQNYDLSMLAMFFTESMIGNAATGKYGFWATSSEHMRKINDGIFATRDDKTGKLRSMPDYLKLKPLPANSVIRGDTITIGKDKFSFEKTTEQYDLYRYWINSGKHIDVARLNEKQQHVGLKRLLGMLGYQILESDTDLSTADIDMTPEDITSVIAYNVSDVINLKCLYEHPVYTAAFELKRQMLIDYPELRCNRSKERVGEDTRTDEDIFNGKPDFRPYKYEPDTTSTKSFRLTINSSSAQFAANSLCPYDYLHDSETVDFNYPSEKIAEQKKVNRRNILTETEDFINNKLEPIATDEGKKVIVKLREMLKMYRAIEGRNFNTIREDEMSHEAEDIRQYSGKVSTFYLGPDGNPTDCYINFSIGGIHGAQYNKALYEEDLKNFRETKAAFDKIRSIYPDALTLVIDVSDGKPKKRKTVDIDGVTYNVSDFVKSGSTMKKAEWKPALLNLEEPTVFTEESSLKKRYTFVSAGDANHEDFVSYYPNLLINMSAFWNNGLNYDRYDEMFGKKQMYKRLINDPSTKPEDKKLYKISQKGVKLVLNSASGAADATFKNNIVMNNRILAMRIIGQLFAWRIGQEQALKGAVVPSTNTDGLYTFFDEEKNNQILEEVSKNIGIEIEPEKLYLVSKDANNRIEAERTDQSLFIKTKDNATGILDNPIKITGRSGGTLACGDGPSPEKSLDHPAVIDWALAEYLLYVTKDGGTLSEFKPDIAKVIMQAALMTGNDSVFKTKEKILNMFQNVIASSNTTLCMNFATTLPVNMADQTKSIPTAEGIQHYTRIFIINPDKLPDNMKENIRYLSAAYCRPNEKGDNSPLSTYVLTNLYKIDKERLRAGRLAVKKLKGIEQDTPCIIENHALSEAKIEPEWLDTNYYIGLLKDTYEKNWSNI